MTLESYKEKESEMQITLGEWLEWKNLFYFSIPNEGKRSYLVGKMMKKMGLRKGATDLCILEPSASGKYSGFFLELKAPGKEPRKEQYDFMDKVRSKGFYADWFDSIDMAIRGIEMYLMF